MGAYGYATSGGVFFDTRSSADGETAWDNEIDTLDTCMGHSNEALQYHYHGVRLPLAIWYQFGLQSTWENSKILSF